MGGRAVHVIISNQAAPDVTATPKIGAIITSAPELGPPSAAALAAADDRRFEFIVETLDLLQSYAISAREAAWRGNAAALKVHLGQARDCLKAAIQTANERVGGP